MQEIGTGIVYRPGFYATERVESNLVGERSGLLSYRTLEIELVRKYSTVLYDRIREIGTGLGA